MEGDRGAGGDGAFEGFYAGLLREEDAAVYAARTFFERFERRTVTDVAERCQLSSGCLVVWPLVFEAVQAGGE